MSKEIKRFVRKLKPRHKQRLSDNWSIAASVAVRYWKQGKYSTLCKLKQETHESSPLILDFSPPCNATCLGGWLTARFRPSDSHPSRLWAAASRWHGAPVVPRSSVAAEPLMTLIWPGSVTPPVIRRLQHVLLFIASVSVQIHRKKNKIISLTQDFIFFFYMEYV